VDLLPLVTVVAVVAAVAISVAVNVNQLLLRIAAHIIIYR
jgi:hypothetical protein